MHYQDLPIWFAESHLMPDLVVCAESLLIGVLPWWAILKSWRKRIRLFHVSRKLCRLVASSIFSSL